jgi:hypothetical protein
LSEREKEVAELRDLDLKDSAIRILLLDAQGSLQIENGRLSVIYMLTETLS